MKTIQQMIVEANRYVLILNTKFGYMTLLEKGSEVEIDLTPNRAKLWIECGVGDLDRNTRQVMFDKINIIEEIQESRKGGK